MTGTTIAQAIPIAISPILTRIYTPEDFGIFALYLSILGLVAVIVTGRYEVAIVLTDGEPADSDLECDGELSWTDISPGATVTGDFVVRNNGAPDSILHWKIESYPTDWGTNWTFTPNASILTIGAGWITVDVEVIAPDDPNEEFTGEVKLVNVLDPSNSCTIDVSLATPRNRAFNINLLFLRFLEQHPHMFPILRHMLGF